MLQLQPMTFLNYMSSRRHKLTINYDLFHHNNQPCGHFLRSTALVHQGAQVCKERLRRFLQTPKTQLFNVVVVFLLDAAS